MIKGFIAITDGGEDIVCERFSHHVMTGAPRMTKNKFDEFIKHADDYAKERLFRNIRISFGIYLESDDSVHITKQIGAAVMYADQHALYDDFVSFYNKHTGLFETLVEKFLPHKSNELTL